MEDNNTLPTEHGIPETHNKVPRWLLVTYFALPIWGIVWLIFFWNGSAGWLDPNYWQQLERAANTTYPTQNVTFPKEDTEDVLTKKMPTDEKS